MYWWCLFLHSWLRWFVLLAGAGVILQAVRNTPYDARDRLFSRLFVGCFDLQALLGLLLYFWLSPTVQLIWQAQGPWMKDRVLRFWSMEHITMMLLALVVAHVGAVKARKAATPRRARRWGAWSAAVALLLVLSSIPWPGLAQGRPLFRL